jgi:AcrR family transcriptional regulator
VSDLQSPSAPKRQPRERTREAILAAAISLYRHEGYGAVTMRAIAQQLGFSAPAIYNYFLSKEEIFVTLQERGLQMLAEAVLTPVTDDPVEDLRQIFVQYYRFTKQHPDYFTLMYVDPSTPRVNPDVEALARMSVETTHRVQRCIDKGIFAPEAIGVASGLMWSMVHGAAVLRQIQEVAPAQNFELLAIAGVDLTIAAVRAGLLPDPLSAERRG